MHKFYFNCYKILVYWYKHFEKYLALCGSSPRKLQREIQCENFLVYNSPFVHSSDIEFIHNMSLVM